MISFFNSFKNVSEEIFTETLGDEEKEVKPSFMFPQQENLLLKTEDISPIL